MPVGTKVGRLLHVMNRPYYAGVIPVRCIIYVPVEFIMYECGKMKYIRALCCRN